MNGIKIRTILFVLGMLLTATAAAQTVTRGPYLQTVTDGSVIVRWRTDVATDSVVRYGLSDTALNSTESVGGSRTEHTVQVNGLNPATQYFYSVGDSGGTLEGGVDYHFGTAPVPGTPTATRIWVIGDSGTADVNAQNVRIAFENWSASNPADFMMMLGDNAYNDGTDAEYQAAVFAPALYQDLLRRLPVWPTLGNHDGHSADSSSQTGPYYDIFDLPTAAEAGGLASGTEAYYSFDYGNIHFICLDSYETDRSVGGNMMQWLESDLAFNDKPWVIAFWHHPPYTKGSHNSDTEGRLIDMRQNALPILEAWGVDLVMAGHSHSYERSYLLDGHYGSSGTLDPVANVLDPGDGNETGDGAYEKPDIIAAENEGAVYAVAGSSGKISGGALNHPAMFVSLNSLGSMVLDITGNRLDAVFIDAGGAVLDEFTLLKTPDLQAPMLAGARAEDGTHVIVDFTERVDVVTGTDTANYSIPGLTISNAALLSGNKSVRLTTSAMTPGASYVLTVNNVQDEAGNAIAPDSQAGFDFVQQMTVSFQDGLAPDPTYDGTSDAYIREASATTNYGVAATLQVDGDEPSGSGTDMNIVIGWDVSQIPATATVDAATINLNTLNVGGPYSCYGLLRAWDQNQVTWNDAAPGSPWGAPGAEAASDRDGPLLCTFNAGSTGPLSIALNNDGIALVQSWVDGTLANNGIVITDPVSSNGADFDSSESATAVNRPRLEVTYTVPVVPPNQPPTASFTYSCTDLDCSFTDTSTDSDGSVVSWSWDFGDGNGSTAQHPSHGYAAGGSYTVSLTVTDDGGETDQASTLVTVTAPPPPLAPTGLAALTFSGSQIDLGWSDNSSDEDGFKVERSPNGTDSWIEIAASGADATAYSDTGLAAGATWFYRVYAHNANGNSGYSNVDSATTFTVPRTIQFSGRSWTVKSSGGPVGPGPNYFGDTADDVWVDGSGHLHLRIEFRDGNWHSSEVITDDVLGHGTYTFTLGSRVDQLDRNIVVGLFTWDTSAPEFNYREIDIEFARWGDPLNDNSQYVVQPWDTLGNTLRWDTLLTGNDSTHAFTWRPDRVEFSSFQDDPPGAAIQSWTYNGPDVPPEGATSGNARINFWLMGGSAPFDGQEAELVIKAFDFTPLPANSPPTAAFTENCTELDCNFTDASLDSDGTISAWAWDFGDGTTSVAQNPSHSYAGAGTYTVELTVTDNEGATDVTSHDVTVSVTPPFTDVVASADIPGSGTVSGTFAATHDDDGTAQSVTERESGGKKPDRYSFLVHTWQFDLPPNAMATVYANTWHGGSPDDDFRFSWSPDSVDYSELFIVSSTVPTNPASAMLPPGTSGTIYIRVEDTDQTPGNRSKDTIFVDHLYVRAESGAGDPPPAPSSLVASAAGASRIDLGWTDNADDESGFRVERSVNGVDFSEVGTAPANDTAFSDTGLDPSTTYWYRVLAWNASGDSAWSNTASATTDDPPPPPPAPSGLFATTAGSSSIDLSWQDNSSTEDGFGIERSTDGSSFAFVGNSAADVAAFADNGLQAGTTYWYRVYAFNVSGNSAYSNTDFATTAAITLSLSGYKSKGRHVVDLAWSGTAAANVDIFRDGVLLTTIPDSGAYTDNTGNKGSATYGYQLCEAGTGNCSDVESVTF